MTIEQIARICHEAIKGLCDAYNDYSQNNWNASPEWQKESAIQAVKFHLENPEADADATHVAWMNDKIDAGWKYGPVKDADKREHPCIADFKSLPQEQQAKDILFKSIVHALKDLLDKQEA